MSKHTHNELGKFVFEFEHNSILQAEESLDDVWKRIIRDIHEYCEADRYKWYYGYLPTQDFTIEQTERPDIIYQCDDFIMGIECFEFDASKKTRKGSTQKTKELKADNEIKEEYHNSEVPEDSFLSIERPVDVEFSITSYYESLNSSFLHHAKSIVDYRKKLNEIAPDKKVLLSFFIEDTTALGNYVVVNEKTEALDPLKIPLFLKLLASTQGIDYVIIKTTELYVPSIRIQRISIPLVYQLSKNCYNSNDKYLQYQYKRQSHFWG